MSAQHAIELVASSTLTTSGSGSWIPVPKHLKKMIGYVDVAGTVSGTTPSMTVDFQTSVDGSTATTVFSGAAITATGKQQTFDAAADYAIPLGAYIRANYTITGTTPSFGNTTIKAYLE